MKYWGGGGEVANSSEWENLLIAILLLLCLGYMSCDGLQRDKKEEQNVWNYLIYLL